MTVEIPLMPKHTLGFYLQLAAIGAGELEDKLTRDLEAIIFNDPSEYVNAVDKIWSIIADTKIKPAVEEECNIVGECERVQPKLYGAGKGDASILGEEAGLNVISQRCGVNTSWCSATLSYVEMVKGNGGPIGGRTSMIMLAKAFAYGKLRGTLSATGEDVVQRDSLGLMLLGGLLSMVSRIRVRDSTYEFYLIPDGSPESLRLANLVYGAFFYKGRLGVSFNDVLSDILRLEVGLSIDLATYIALLIHLSRVINEMTGISGLLEKEGFERFLLARVDSSGNRPQLISISPLTMSYALKTLKGKEVLLENLWRLTRTSSKLRKSTVKERRRTGEDLASAIGECFNNLALFLWTGREDVLFECSRRMSVVLDTPVTAGLSDDDRNRVKWVLGEVSRLAGSL